MNVTTFLLVVNNNSSLKKCIFMVHPIFKCLMERNSYSKTIILTEIFVIIHILSLFNKAVKYFLNHTKTFKKIVTSNVYSLWPSDAISISWEWLQVVKVGVQFWKFLQFLRFFSGVKSHKGKMTPKWNSTSLFILN